MTITLDAAAQKRVEREIALGHYREPGEVLAHTLSLLDIESLDQFKLGLERRIARSMAEVERGGGIAGDQLLDVLAERRKARQPRA